MVQHISAKFYLISALTSPRLKRRKKWHKTCCRWISKSFFERKIMKLNQKNHLMILAVLVFLNTGLTSAFAVEDVKSPNSTTTDPTTNTGHNKDYKVAPVADDQAKGSVSDVEITRQIRREITKNNSLSVSAKNVKIITMNGAVTLRGPVNSGDEIKTITEVANRHAVNHQVTNELEIKNKK